MDWLTFFSHVITSLTWPVTVLLLVLVLRVEVAALLNRISKIKAGKLAVDLKDYRELLKGAERELPPPRVPEVGTVLRELPAPHPPAGIQREVREKWELGAVPVRATPRNLAPADLVETAWQRLKRTLIQKARAAGDARVRSADSAVASLAEKEKVNSAFEDSFDQVQLVYRQTRDQPIDEGLAQEFARACERLLEHLAETLV